MNICFVFLKYIYEEHYYLNIKESLSFPAPFATPASRQTRRQKINADTPPAFQIIKPKRCLNNIYYAAE